jgi:hypothetical protein
MYIPPTVSHEQRTNGGNINFESTGNFFDCFGEINYSWKKLHRASRWQCDVLYVLRGPPKRPNGDSSPFQWAKGEIDQKFYLKQYGLLFVISYCFSWYKQRPMNTRNHELTKKRLQSLGFSQLISELASLKLTCFAFLKQQLVESLS